MRDIARRLVAEGLGTAFLVATVVGSGVMASRLTEDAALALLGNSLATGAILVVLISTFGPISGAHFNPAVSIVLALRRELPLPELGPYVIVQTLGAVAGALAAHFMFGLPFFEVSTHVRSGGGQWFSEAVATFGMVMVILAGTRFQKTPEAWLVGLYITAAYWFTASTSFANPAVTIARALSDTFSGIRPADAPWFIIAQLAGALIALALAGWLIGPGPASAAKESA